MSPFLPAMNVFFSQGIQSLIKALLICVHRAATLKGYLTKQKLDGNITELNTGLEFLISFKNSK